jgi:phosphate transport system permease protein
MTPIEKLGNVNNRKRWSQKIAFGFFTSLSYLVVLILFVILGFIIIKGASVISWDFLTKSPEEGMTSGGIYPAIVGTLYLVLGSSLISFPIGVMSGILHE